MEHSVSSGFAPADKLVRAFSNFKKSGAPSRFLVLSEGTWADVAHKVFDEVMAGFLAGKTTLEIAVSEKSNLFDFLGMSRIDLNTGKWNSIGWIDVHGSCFFPVVDDDERQNLSESLRLRTAKKGPVHGREQNAEVSSRRWPDTKLLSDDDNYYKSVEKLFLSGVKRFIPDAIITSMHECLYSICSANSRQSSFQRKQRETMEARGAANFKYGWYGSSATNVSAILSHGFRQPNCAALHGWGIHISSSYSPYDSALLSEVDENGEKHLLLCGVIMGKSEKIEAGSVQDRPSNGGFDTGVDDIVNPRWYVVWNAHMNTHIIPVCVVSFKYSGNSQGVRIEEAHGSAEVVFCDKSSIVEAVCRDWKMLVVFKNAGKISNEMFIRYMRAIAGISC